MKTRAKSGDPSATPLTVAVLCRTAARGSWPVGVRSLTVAVLCGALPAPNRERERADGRPVEDASQDWGSLGNRSLTVAALCGALPAPNRERERADGRSVEGVFNEQAPRARGRRATPATQPGPTPGLRLLPPHRPGLPPEATSAGVPPSSRAHASVQGEAADTPPGLCGNMPG